MKKLTVKAKQDHLQRIAATKDPVKAIAEFVWNALDGNATSVAVQLLKNDLGGIEAIRIDDNGTGISNSRAQHDFESAGESWKRQKLKNESGRALHGKEGVGRLRFYSLAHKAKWTTVYSENGKRFRLEIEIDAADLQGGQVSEPTEVGPNTPTGTIVELSNLKSSLDALASEQARIEFGSIFAGYLLQYTNIEISFDDIKVDAAKNIDTLFEFPRVSLTCPNRVVRDLVLRIIEWKPGSGGNRRIHFGGERGIVLGSLPANITAPHFEFSIYAYSKLFQEMADANLLEVDGLTDPDFAYVLEHIRIAGADYFRSRQAEKAGQLIDDLKSAGVYPYEGDPKDDVERREREVFEIATHAVSSYSRDFKKADNPLKKITLSLLKEAVSRNPDSLIRILTAVFDLPRARQDEFSTLLAKTELGNIISASTMVSDRIETLQLLRHLVFSPKHQLTTKERGELDVVIRDNTWIFGEGFHIAMPEVGLTKVMDRVAEDLASKRARKTRATKLDGKIGRVDSFVGREIPSGDKRRREYLLIELKRPSLIVGRKELDQLEDYVNAILNQPDYENTNTIWHFYLVTSEYSKDVAPRVNQANRPSGLYLEGDRYKVWVKLWSELIRDCEARLSFVQEKLKVEVSDEDIEMRITSLRESVVRASRSKHLPKSAARTSPDDNSAPAPP